jgi:transcriptional regulator with XRE-family HTH domain
MRRGKPAFVSAKSVRPYQYRLGQNIRDARLERDVSLKDLAAAIGSHASTVHRVENATRGDVLLTTVIRICVALGINPSEVMP